MMHIVDPEKTTISSVAILRAHNRQDRVQTPYPLLPPTLSVKRPLKIKKAHMGVVPPTLGITGSNCRGCQHFQTSKLVRSESLKFVAIDA